MGILLKLQQQLPNNSHFCGVWEDPDVDDLTSINKLAYREIVSNGPTENVSNKIQQFEKRFANKIHLKLLS